MTFLDIPAATTVFVDSNVLVYHFGHHPALQAPCQRLLERISRGEIAGVTSAAVLSHLAHRLMTIEAAAKYGWPMTGIAARLKQRKAEIQSLVEFRTSIQEVANFGLQVASVESSHVVSAAALS
jgi:predicted nucleic acid-binding protein